MHCKYNCKSCSTIYLFCAKTNSTKSLLLVFFLLLLFSWKAYIFVSLHKIMQFPFKWGAHFSISLETGINNNLSDWTKKRGRRRRIRKCTIFIHLVMLSLAISVNINRTNKMFLRNVEKQLNVVLFLNRSHINCILNNWLFYIYERDLIRATIKMI